MFFPKDIASIKKVYKYILDNNIPYFLIGSGTNLLINERYFDQIFINLKDQHESIRLLSLLVSMFLAETVSQTNLGFP